MLNFIATDLTTVEDILDYTSFIFGTHCRSYAGSSNWNSLPAYLKDSSLSLSSFKHHLKTFLCSFYQASTRSAFGVLLQKNALYKFTVIIIIIGQPTRPTQPFILSG